jgi:hypothetical protein
MATIKCTACGRQMGRNATRCPGCWARAPKAGMPGLPWREGLLAAVSVVACLVLLQDPPPDGDGVDSGASDATAATRADEPARQEVDPPGPLASDERARQAVDRYMTDNDFDAEQIEAATGMDRAELIARVGALLDTEPDADPAILIKDMQRSRNGVGPPGATTVTASGEP